MAQNGKGGKRRLRARAALEVAEYEAEVMEILRTYSWWRVPSS